MKDIFDELIDKIKTDEKICYDFTGFTIMQNKQTINLYFQKDDAIIMATKTPENIFYINSVFSKGYRYTSYEKVKEKLCLEGFLNYIKKILKDEVLR